MKSLATMDGARIYSRGVSTIVLAVSMILTSSSGAVFGEGKEHEELDAKVEAFLAKNRHAWRDMNVPTSDGQLLHDLVVEGQYTRALEIGTSTGHSGIWIAWALAKTGGKLITVEINERRYREALANFEEAGLSNVVDGRLADAHVLVPELEGPFDFVFVDADKDWYVRYLEMVLPKLEPGGCFTAHNVTTRRGGWVREFLEALYATPGLETEIDESGNGLSVSFLEKGTD
jgi:predicted O-methyltransferase YrrM